MAAFDVTGRRPLRTLVLLMIGVAALLPFWALAGRAAAGEGPVGFTVASDTAALTDTGNGKPTFSVALTNLTDTSLAVEATSEKCKGIGPQNAPAGLTSTLTFTIEGTDDACAEALSAGGERFTLATPTPLTRTTITVAKQSDAAEINWMSIVAAYGIAIFAAVVLLIVVVLVNWKKITGEAVRSAAAFARLPNLAATYSFKDSWASNITLLVGVLTAVLGSADVLKAISASATKTAQSQSLVASAISVALVALAPVVVQMTRRHGEDDRPKYANDAAALAKTGLAYRTYSTTVLGVVVAGAITLGAGGGLAFIIGDAAKGLDLDGIEHVWWLLIIVPCLLLAVYGVTNLRTTLITGWLPPAPAGTLQAKKAEMVWDALRIRHEGGDLDGTGLADALALPTPPTSPELPDRRESAVF